MYLFAQVVEALLEARADPDQRTPMDGSTALIPAACYGHSTVVLELIHANGSADVATRDGITALYVVFGFWCLVFGFGFVSRLS